MFGSFSSRAALCWRSSRAPSASPCSCLIVAFSWRILAIQVFSFQSSGRSTIASRPIVSACPSFSRASSSRPCSLAISARDPYASISESLQNPPSSPSTSRSCLAFARQYSYPRRAPSKFPRMRRIFASLSKATCRPRVGWSAPCSSSTSKYSSALTAIGSSRPSRLEFSSSVRTSATTYVPRDSALACDVSARLRASRASAAERSAS